jgi:hypothetical protein
MLPQAWQTTKPCDPSAWNHGEFVGNHPKIAASFSLVNYTIKNHVYGILGVYGYHH